MPPTIYRPTVEYRNSAVTLADYAQIIQYDEPAFWGVYYDGQPSYGCTNIWTEFMRISVARALAHAQEMVEDYVNHFLADTWVVGTLAEADSYNPHRYVDEGNYKFPYVARYGRIQEFGVRVEEDLGAFSVSHLTDPAIVGPISGVTSARELKVFLPGTKREVHPSGSYTQVDGLYLEIPRVRLLKESLLWLTGDENPEVRYEVESNFTDSVDIKRVYTDNTTQAKLVSNHACNSSCFTTGCSEYSVDGCVYVKDGPNGIVEIVPATYTGGQWVRNNSCSNYRRVRLYYKSGLPTLNTNLQEAVVRLAHSLMATEPCGCQITQRLWQRDRNVPDYVTRQRSTNPFGVTDGAWWAYEQVRNFRFRLRTGVL